MTWIFLSPATLTGRSGVVTAMSRLAASTQNQALSAILFLYKEVLGRELEWLDNVERAKRPARVPVVLTEAEVRALLGQMEGRQAFMARILYGAGLRLMECVRLRVKDVDFGYSQITVRDGKGDKDRVTILPASLHANLLTHLEQVKATHQKDLEAGFGEVIFAVRARPQVSAGRPRVGLAVRLSGRPAFARSALGGRAAPSHRRADPAAGGQEGRQGSRDSQARELPHLAP